MFERGPFQTCPGCGAAETFGILRVGGETMQRRCKACQFSLDEMLPAIDKKVIYLDQFAISEFYKVKSKTRRQSARVEQRQNPFPNRGHEARVYEWRDERHNQYLPFAADRIHFEYR